MLDRTLARGVFIACVALVFGLSSLQYRFGTFSRPGPGLFPIMMSGTLLLIGMLTIVKSFLVERQAVDLHVKNIALILAGLAAFAVLSSFVNMIAGITALVFIVSLAAETFSWLRCVKISASLIAVAFAFQMLLGLNLPLY